MPLSQLSILLVAVFLLFSIVGFYTDMMQGGGQPYAVEALAAGVGGLYAVVWILVLARLPKMYILALALAQMVSPQLNIWMSGWLTRAFHLQPVEPHLGIRVSATATLVAVIASYSCFVSYIRTTGREAFRLRNELALAHSIQKTLVPPIARVTRCFEVYGRSEPSEKVGGDLVDFLSLPDGDSVVYVADVAGHGLQAGILMGMLKTSARTVLLENRGGEGEASLRNLMERLNLVLPQVKESHMYATFTGLRLNEDGKAFFGLAASPPLLHWRATTETVTRIEEEQFPLGLLPISGFTAHAVAMEEGDVLLLATDGVTEVATGAGVEFGVEALERLLCEVSALPLEGVAARVLQTVQAYGKQMDDQTLLLVRRRVEKGPPGA